MRRDGETYEQWQAALAAMHDRYEAADQAEYVAWTDEVDARDVRRWADNLPVGPAASGAELEQRHVLDEAAHPDLVAAFRRLAPTV
uniref:hypothetical protein n=1 Tax=Kitasatospora indigofera TaxID=67307 RepID=UPI002F9186DA